MEGVLGKVSWCGGAGAMAMVRGGGWEEAGGARRCDCAQKTAMRLPAYFAMKTQWTTTQQRMECQHGGHAGSASCGSRTVNGCGCAAHCDCLASMVRTA
jgi:hypothetical protein